MANGITVERLTGEMLSGTASLEALCFAEPWSENSLSMLTRGGGVGFAVLDGGRVVAYGGMLTVLDEGQITNIATHPDYRRKGLAREIMRALEGYAKKSGIALLTLEVRRSNSAAISLYCSMGWSECGVRKNFYRFPSEDAILMEKKLG